MSEQFAEENGTWVCRIRSGLFDASEILEDEPLERDGAIAFESTHWPAKVLAAGVETFLVPIKVAFAEALLDPGLAERSLLPRRLGLGLNREHVYYRSTKNDRGICQGARILWYVTGGSTVHREGSVRAVSQVAEVIVAKPRTLHARFERFGVYSLEQVSALKDGNGEVMAIRFVNTEVLEKPLSLAVLRKMWGEEGDQFVAPQSPSAISEHMFCRLYRESSRYGR